MIEISIPAIDYEAPHSLEHRKPDACASCGGHLEEVWMSYCKYCSVYMDIDGEVL